MKTIYLAAALASALSVSAPAQAGFFDFTLAPFVGASIGQSTIDICPAGASCDDTDTAWKIFGGLEVNEYLSMEVGYADLGEAKFSDATSSATAEVNGMTLAMVGTFAVSPSFTLIGRGGMNILNLEVDAIDRVASNDGDTDVAWSLGVGAQYNFTESVGLRVEYERFFDVGDEDTTGEADVDLISAGIVFKF